MLSYGLPRGRTNVHERGGALRRSPQTARACRGPRGAPNPSLAPEWRTVAKRKRQ